MQPFFEIRRLKGPEFKSDGMNAADESHVLLYTTPVYGSVASPTKVVYPFTEVCTGEEETEEILHSVSYDACSPVHRGDSLIVTPQAPLYPLRSRDELQSTALYIQLYVQQETIQISVI